MFRCWRRDGRPRGGGLAFKPTLEQYCGGDFVDDVASFFRLDVAFGQGPMGSGGGEAFVVEDDRDGECVSKLFDLIADQQGRLSLATIEAER